MEKKKVLLTIIIFTFVVKKNISEAIAH